MAAVTCRGCGRPHPTGKYLCWRCWHTLPADTRQQLNLRDDHAARRAVQLFAQIRAGTPLADIRVPPPTASES